jgi:hypothetical protein
MKKSFSFFIYKTMKHLKKFFESSNEELNDILENLVYICDAFGRPQIDSYRIGKGEKYILTWGLGMDFSHLQDAKSMIDKLKLITENIEDVLSAQDRLGNWNFSMSISNELRIELNPKDLGEEEYEFISKYEWRTLYVFKNEIERFFNSKGMRVTRWDLDSSFDEYNQRNDLEIYLDKEDYLVTGEFIRLFEEELSRKQNEIDREYEVYDGGDYVAIRSIEEKSAIDTIRKK